ncbi:7918_t:CDS:10, partial [Acaulospora morrowiae]
IIEDDDDDELLQNSNLEEAFVESFQDVQTTLRRSTRSRRGVIQQDYVPTIEAVPLHGDIPLRDASSSTHFLQKRPYEFSLSSLLQEKRHREKAGYDIQALEQAIQENVLDEEMDDPFEHYNRSEISASIFDEETKHDSLQQIFEEDDMMDSEHSLEFFEINTDLDLPKPILRKPNSKLKDDAFALIYLAASDDERLKDILSSYWIPQQYEMGLDLPDAIIIWLLQLVSFGQDMEIVEEASCNLKRLTEISGRFRNELNITPGVCVHFSLIYNIFVSYGASTQILDFHCPAEQLKISSPSELQSQFLHIRNLRSLLKIITPLLENSWLSFSHLEEIRRAIVIILRLSLDGRMTSILGEVETIVDALLQRLEDADWNSQAKFVCKDIISACGNDTQFKVAMLSNLPVSTRGRLIRRLLSFYFLFSVSSIKFDLDELDVSKPPKIEHLSDLFKDGVKTFKIHNETNYRELYNNILFLGYTMDDATQILSEKDKVEEIIKYLRHLHGKIVDMRAAFMDRTKAKDLIQRLFMRLFCVTSYRRGKTQQSILKCTSKASQKTLDMFVEH